MRELKIIGRNIVFYRKKKALTQEYLCGLAQIDRSYLSEVENGKMNITIKSLVQIAEALDVKLTDLMDSL
jgi:transcriptional regulator with XRE-family HTH domain